MARALGLTDYLDALSASGIRGMRMAAEAGAGKVTCNDVSPGACALIKRNLARNGLACEALCDNANVLMHERRFQAVDLDPFGSPSAYLAAASRCTQEYLFITATDTAPLCGAHLLSGIRKYLARPLCTDYHREMGARILLGLAARELARLDKGMQPLLTHVTDHYVRTYLRVVKGAKAGDTTLEHMGYVEHCPICGSFVPRPEPAPEGICGHCRGRTAGRPAVAGQDTGCRHHPPGGRLWWEAARALRSFWRPARPRWTRPCTMIIIVSARDLNVTPCKMETCCRMPAKQRLQGLPNALFRYRHKDRCSSKGGGSGLDVRPISSGFMRELYPPGT